MFIINAFMCGVADMMDGFVSAESVPASLPEIAAAPPAANAGPASDVAAAVAFEIVEDGEWARLSAIKGRQYRVELTRKPEVGGVDDSNTPSLALFDALGGPVEASMFSQLGFTRLVFIAPQDGEFLIRSDVAEGNLDDFALTVIDEAIDDFAATAETAGVAVVGVPATGVIDFAGDRDWFRVALDADELYIFRVDPLPGSDAPLGGGAAALLDADGEFLTDIGIGSDASYRAFAGFEGFVEVSADTDVGAYAISIERVLDIPADATTPSFLTLGAPTSGRIDFPRDSDWHGLAVEAGGFYRIAVTSGADSPTPLFFSTVDLRAQDGRVLAHDLDRDGVIEFLAREDGFVFTTVTSFFGPSDYVVAAEQAPVTLSLHVAGTGSSEHLPSFLLEVDGAAYGRFTIDDLVPNDFDANDPANFHRIDVALDGNVAPDRVRIIFDSDVYRPAIGLDVNLFVDAIEIAGVRIEAEEHGVFTAARNKRVPVAPREDLLWDGTQEFSGLRDLVDDALI